MLCVPAIQSRTHRGGFTLVSKLGHCGFQIRPLRLETGQYPAVHGIQIGNSRTFAEFARDVISATADGDRRRMADPPQSVARYSVSKSVEVANELEGHWIKPNQLLDDHAHFHEKN
jgi:hypothetical protein